MDRPAAITLSFACAVFAVLSGARGLALYKQPRFITTKGENPFIMFDTKTARTCWSGPGAGVNPNGDPFAKYGGRAVTDPYSKHPDETINPANLPLCEELK